MSENNKGEGNNCGKNLQNKEESCNGSNMSYRSLESLALFYPQNEDSRVGLVGLKNIGNTCYMNSVFQSLSNCPQFVNYLLTLVPFDESRPKNSKPSLSSAFAKLMSRLWSNENGSLTPAEVSRIFKHDNYNFNNYRQQDCQEFLRCLVDKLQTDLKVEVPKRTDECSFIKETSSGGDASLLAVKVDVAMTEDRIENEDDEDKMSVDGYVEKPRTDQAQLNYNELRSSSNPPPPLPMDHAPSTPTNQNAAQEARECDKLIASPTSPAKKRQPAATDGVIEHKQRKEMYVHTNILSDVLDGEICSSVQCRTCFSKSPTTETYQDLSLSILNKDELQQKVLNGVVHTSLSVHNDDDDDGGGHDNGVLQVVPIPPVYSWLWTVWDHCRSYLSSWVWGPEVHLTDCLSAFFSADELKGDNMYSCEKCSKLRIGVKQCELVKLPEVLTIHLKRFRHEGLSLYSSKISTNVKFPLKGLDMSKYLANESKSQISTYDLFSVIQHQGGSTGGHYVALTRNSVNGKWYEYNDSYVTQVSEATVENTEAYVLFYRKRESGDMLELRKKVLLMESKRRPTILNFYVSAHWMAKFFNFAQPGPIDNRYFLCPHGDVEPSKYNEDYISREVCKVSEEVWGLLVSRFGSLTPPVTSMRPCQPCLRYRLLLQHKRNSEYDMFLQLSESAERESQASYYISMRWFRRWQLFITSKQPEPPSQIDNTLICKPRNNNNSSFVLDKNSEFGEIAEDAWRYLLGRYGGGPELVASTGPHH